MGVESLILSHTFLILKINTTFEEVQMLLKRFFDLSKYWFQIFKDQCESVPSILESSLNWSRKHNFVNSFISFSCFYYLKAGIIFLSFKNMFVLTKEDKFWIGKSYFYQNFFPISFRY